MSSSSFSDSLRSEPDHGVARPRELLRELPLCGVVLLLPDGVAVNSEFGLQGMASSRVCCGVLRRGILGAPSPRWAVAPRHALSLLSVFPRCGVEEPEATGVAAVDVLAETLREALDEPKLAACRKMTQGVRKV